MAKIYQSCRWAMARSAPARSVLKDSRSRNTATRQEHGERCRIASRTLGPYRLWPDIVLPDGLADFKAMMLPGS